MDTTRIAATPFTDAERDWSTPRTLREATQEFEGLFIAHMMQTMRRSVPGSKLLGSGSGQTIFREMLDQELARQIAHSGGFGIGEMLYQERVLELRQQLDQGTFDTSADALAEKLLKGNVDG